MKKLDCLFIIAPIIHPGGPTPGPSLLKAHLKRNGFTSKVIDYNVRLWNDLNNAGHHDFAQKFWFEGDNGDLFDPDDFKSEINVTHLHLIEYVKECINENAEWIGISLLSGRSTSITVDFIKEIKKINPNQKIVIGGPGAESYISIKEYHQAPPPDQIILGDGDEAIVSLLKGEQISNQPYQLQSLDDLPYADYSDIEWDSYLQHNTSAYRDRRNQAENMITADTQGNRIFITGSRGCVRRCTFCDVKHYWPKFKYRPGKDIAGEILYLHNKYGFHHFTLTDSLINGSIKAFKETCEEITKTREEKKKKNIRHNIQWSGQFICRSKQQMPESLWADMAASGINFLNIGIESGSESVRDHMGKKFSNEDMYYTFDMATKFGIIIIYNIIIGYPTETDKDFQDTLSLIKYVSDLNQQIPTHSHHAIGSLRLLSLCTHYFTSNSTAYRKQIDLTSPEMIAELGLEINPTGFDGNWKLKNKTEGLPYNKVVRFRRLVDALLMLHENCNYEFSISVGARKHLTSTIMNYKEITRDDSSLDIEIPKLIEIIKTIKPVGW
jgi:hypothetical protein